jgi:hypothetical protein
MMPINVTRKELDELHKIADWMDSRFIIPGTQIRFGLDSLLGLIPGIGDTVTLATTGYFLKKAHDYKLPFHVKSTMVWNLFIDWLVGLIPLIGDIFDVAFKANRKNVALLHKYCEKSDHIQIIETESP